MFLLRLVPKVDIDALTFVVELIRLQPVGCRVPRILWASDLDMNGIGPACGSGKLWACRAKVIVPG